MQRLRKLAVLAAFAGVAATTAYAVGYPQRWSTRRTPAAFSITGKVEGLYPGGHVPLAVRIKNPYSSALRVRSISIRIDPSGHPCPVGNLRITPFRGSLLVPRHASRTLDLDATLRLGAPLACQGVVFPLRFYGRAVRR